MGARLATPRVVWGFNGLVKHGKCVCQFAAVKKLRAVLWFQMIHQELRADCFGVRGEEPETYVLMQGARVSKFFPHNWNVGGSSRANIFNERALRRDWNHFVFAGVQRHQWNGFP